jgi:hypothetical protein
MHSGTRVARHSPGRGKIDRRAPVFRVLAIASGLNDGMSLGGELILHPEFNIVR